jgi:hypothetical protein
MMHWLVVVLALVAWHVLTLAVLWFIPLPPRLERWKPALMAFGVVIAVILVLHHELVLRRIL